MPEKSELLEIMTAALAEADRAGAPDAEYWLWAAMNRTTGQRSELPDYVIARVRDAYVSANGWWIWNEEPNSKPRFVEHEEWISLRLKHGKL